MSAVAEIAPLLTVAEVAAVLRVTPDTVYAKVEKGELAAVRLGRGPRGPIRVSVDELKRYLTDGQEERTEA
jgi:excisionase family DNA binding protein